MSDRNMRRASLIAGVVVVAVYAIIVTQLRPLGELTTVIGVHAFGLLGVVLVVAGTDTFLTDRWAWYQWSGIGRMLVAVFVCMAAIESYPAFISTVAGAVISLSQLIRGANLVLFHGEYDVSIGAVTDRVHS